MLRLACAVALLTATIDLEPLLAQEVEVEDDGSYNMFFSAGLGRFAGDYGEEEESDARRSELECAQVLYAR